MILSTICRGYRHSKIGIALIAHALFACGASAQDFPALYRKNSADLKRCALEKEDPNLRLKCFDRVVAELDIDQKLFPAKVPPPTPDKGPFDISGRSEDRNVIDSNRVRENPPAALPHGRVDLDRLLNEPSK